MCASHVHKRGERKIKREGERKMCVGEYELRMFVFFLRASVRIFQEWWRGREEEGKEHLSQ